MKKGKLGFTLIEVAIFLAITGILFVGVTAGVQNSIYQQRTNDAVQNFVEFLRTAYAEVNDVQSSTSGSSDKAVYGKLITFGEGHNLAGVELGEGQNEIFKYTVIGDISNDTERRDVIGALRSRSASVEFNDEFAGIAESYTPRWAAQIEPACKNDNLASCDFEPIEGMLLIVRHPISGTVTTLWSDDVVEINEARVTGLIFGDDDRDDRFVLKQIDFCINTTGEEGVYNRMDVQIERGARNASGIELIGSNTEGYRCGE